jgi:hypothetical protein
MTPASRSGLPRGETYVVCLDCGKHFAYDARQMRIGKPLLTPGAYGVLPPDAPKPRRKKLKMALLASLPLAVLIGSVLKSRNTGAERKPPQR